MSDKDKYYQNPQLQQLDIENILIDGINKHIPILGLIDKSDYAVPNPRILYEIERKEIEAKKQIELEALIVEEKLKKHREEEEEIFRKQAEEEQRKFEEEILTVINQDLVERDKLRKSILKSYKSSFQSSLFIIVNSTQSKINSIINRDIPYVAKLYLVELGRSYLGKAKLIDEYFIKNFYASDLRTSRNTSRISTIKDDLRSLELNEGKVVKGSTRIIHLGEDEIEKYADMIFQLEEMQSQKRIEEDRLWKIQMEEKERQKKKDDFWGCVGGILALLLVIAFIIFASIASSD